MPLPVLPLIVMGVVVAAAAGGGKKKPRIPLTKLKRPLVTVAEPLTMAGSAVFAAAICNNGPESARNQVERLASLLAQSERGPRLPLSPENIAEYEREEAWRRYEISRVAWSCLADGLQKDGSFHVTDSSGNNFHWSYETGIPAFVAWQVEERQLHPALGETATPTFREFARSLASQPRWGRPLQYDYRSIEQSWIMGGRHWLEQQARSALDVQLVDAASDEELPGIVAAILFDRRIPEWLAGPVPKPEVDWAEAFAMLAGWGAAAAAVATAGAAGGLLAAGYAAYDAYRQA